MKKMPEPFIALRADELTEIQQNKILFSEIGLLNARDDDGILWAPYGGSMTGEVLFSQIHPVRQMMCMKGPYCQVCGTSLLGKFTPWILNGTSDWDEGNAEKIRDGKSIVTITAPTCVQCQQVAMKVCPHLLKNPNTARLLVRSYRPYGLFGDLVRSRDMTVLEEERAMVLKFGSDVYHRALPFFVAKQLVVEIRRYKVLNRA